MKPLKQSGEPGFVERGEAPRIVVTNKDAAEPALPKTAALPVAKDTFLSETLPEIACDLPGEMVESLTENQLVPGAQMAYLVGPHEGEMGVYAVVQIDTEKAPVALVEAYSPPILVMKVAKAISKKPEKIVAASKEVNEFKVGGWFQGEWFPLVKSDDEEKRLITCVVLEPDVVDKQGDIYSAAVVEAAAHDYLANYNSAKARPPGYDGTETSEQHVVFGVDVDVVESWIAPFDLELNGFKIKKGTWIATFRVRSDDLWEKVKAGKITGVSIGGVSRVRFLNGFDEKS